MRRHMKNAAEVVKLLIDHGADVEAKDEESRTPLHTAAAKNALGCGWNC